MKGRILTGKRAGVIKIPRTALLTWDVAAKKAEVFVVNGDIARRQTVRTGNISGDQVEITVRLSSGAAGDHPAVDSTSKTATR